MPAVVFRVTNTINNNHQSLATCETMQTITHTYTVRLGTIYRIDWSRSLSKRCCDSRKTLYYNRNTDKSVSRYNNRFASVDFKKIGFISAQTQFPTVTQYIHNIAAMILPSQVSRSVAPWTQ